MKTSNLILLIIVVVLMTFITITMYQVKSMLSQNVVEASGDTVEKTYDVDPFQKIQVTSGIMCQLKKADEPLVIANLDEAYVDILTIDVSENGTLMFKIDGAIKEKIKVEVYYTDLEQLNVSSAECSGEVISDSLHLINLAAGGNLDANIEASYCNLQVSSGSEANLRGVSQSLNVAANSGADIRAADLETLECVAVATSGAHIDIKVKQSLSASANSGAQINYHGDPETTTFNTNSGGDIRKN